MWVRLHSKVIKTPHSVYSAGTHPGSPKVARLKAGDDGIFEVLEMLPWIPKPIYTTSSLIMDIHNLVLPVIK